MASLLTIPLELLVAVSVYLPTPDLCALRLACKQVERSLYQWFADEFFTKKQFMITHKSLQALVDISNHVSFSKKLAHVIIASNNYGDNAPLRFKNYDQVTRYMEGCEDQRVLINNGLGREMLTEAFANLPNLQVVGMRDFDSSSRRRDGQYATWSAWGSTTVFRETGFQMGFSSSPYLNGTSYPEHIFQTLTYALVKAKRFPREFEALMSKNKVPDRAFHVPKFMEPAMEPLLFNFRSLVLSLSLDQRTIHTHNNGAKAYVAGHTLRRFLSLTPNLEHLRLNFTKWQDGPNLGFLEWLALPCTAPPQPINNALDTPPIHPKLKQLDLGFLDTVPHAIYGVVAKFAPTLTSLGLWRMSIGSHDGTFHDRPHNWISLMERIANLEQLHLTYLKIGWIGEAGRFIVFVDPAGGIADKHDTVREFEGKTGMDKHLVQLMDQLAFQPPPEADGFWSGEDDEMAVDAEMYEFDGAGMEDEQYYDDEYDEDEDSVAGDEANWGGIVR